MSVRGAAEFETLPGTTSNHQGLPTAARGRMCVLAGGSHFDARHVVMAIHMSKPDETLGPPSPALMWRVEWALGREKGTGQGQPARGSGIRTSTGAQRGFLDQLAVCPGPLRRDSTASVTAPPPLQLHTQMCSGLSLASGPLQAK